MTDPPETTQHDAPPHVFEGYIAWRAGETFTRIVRNDTPFTNDGHHFASDDVPLIVVHGGPGCTHDYLRSLDDLSSNRAVVYYDQLGNGRSTHLPEAPPEFWTVELFLEELDALLNRLGIVKYDLLGQSWGGMLGAEHAVRQPPGLRRLIIANSPASMPLWREAALGLRAGLSASAQSAITHFEAIGAFSAPEYQAASAEFYSQHVCRLVPYPEAVQHTFDWVDRDPTVYHAMNGPSEFLVIGSLRDWSVVDRLSRVSVPTLVINGAFDEATDATVAPFIDRISGSQWVRFEGSSHMPHWEERVAFMQVVEKFLT